MSIAVLDLSSVTPVDVPCCAVCKVRMSASDCAHCDQFTCMKCVSDCCFASMKESRDHAIAMLREVQSVLDVALA